MADKVRITLVRSPIGRLPKHRRTVAALGLRKLNQSVEKVKDASTIGMINAVSYLLRVEDV